MYFPQEVEVGMEVTTTHTGNEETQTPEEKAPVRFGWVTGVMVSKTWTKASYTTYFNCADMKQSYKHLTELFLSNVIHRFVAC